MITYDEVLNLNYYKKTSYTGWTGGMRFLIRREEPETPDGNDADVVGEKERERERADADGELLSAEPFFHVFAWPGPYIFEKTPDEKKIESRFPFSEEGKRAAVDWLNQQLTEKEQLWPKYKTAFFNISQE